MSRPKKAVDILVVGGTPRVHLLPPEVVQHKKSRALRRRLIAGVVLVLVVAATAGALATLNLGAAQNSLLAEQTRASALLIEQQKYSLVLNTQADVDATVAAQRLATAQEIDWQTYLAAIEDTLPKKARITSIAAAIDAPFAATVPTEIPLEGPRIATITVTVLSPQKSISDWLDDLRALPGYVDANPGSVTQDEDGKYIVVVVMHVNSDALSQRFATQEEAKK